MFFKKLVSIFTAGILIISLVSSSVFAVSRGNLQKYVFSEYDYIVSIRKMSKSELDKMDLPSSEKQLICSDQIENEIMDRKKQSDDVLMKYYGYTADEIAILRSYNGGRLEDHKELRAITGTLTIDTPIVMQSTAQKIAVKVYWDWDHQPIVNMKDAFCATWSATFKNGKYGNLIFDKSQSNHIIWYTPGGVSASKKVPIQNTVPDRAVKSEFPMTSADGRFWARSGTFNLYLKSAANDVSIASVSFVFAYGHTTLGFSPSVSFDSSGLGVGISFGFGTSQADLISGYVKADGKNKWNY